MSSVNLNPTNTPLLKQFIDRYQIWFDYKSTYLQLHNRNTFGKERAVTSNPAHPAINCYPGTDVGGINSDPNKIVFVDNLTEGINFKNYFRHYQSDKYYVIFSNGRWDEEYYKLPFAYGQVCYMYFLFDMVDNYLSDNRFSFYIDKTYMFGEKNYDFIATAGSPRPEKDGFVNLLLEKIQYKNFILRYNGKDLGQPYNDPLVNCLPNGYKSDQHIPGLEKYFHSLSQTLPIDLYNLGFFNLLLEGDISWECQFNLTEKTVKTLVTGMPFVMVSSPFFLAELRKLGFETYSTLWDESYDNLVDYDLRMSALVDLCNNLQQFNWGANLTELKRIADKNRANFFNLGAIANRHFEQMESVLAAIPVDIEKFKC